MSQEGRIRRGEKWDSQRDAKGKLPDGVINNPSKMADVNCFLENSKPPEPKVEETPKKKKREY